MRRLEVWIVAVLVLFSLNHSGVTAQEAPAPAPATSAAPQEATAKETPAGESPIPEAPPTDAVPPPPADPANPEPESKEKEKKGDEKKEEKKEPEKPKPMELAADVPVSVIAFGEGVVEDRPQPIWKSVLAKGPKLFLFLGDVITGNTDSDGMRQLKYTLLKRRLNMDEFRARVFVMATWDDMDYGLADSGAEFPNKEASKKMFLEYFGEPQDSPRWQHPGVYDAKIFGPAGKRLQVIMLDTRSFRGPLVKRKQLGFVSDGYPGTYTANTDTETTILGNEQWQWLGEQLRQPAELRLICSSIQVVSEEHGYEKWMNFPHERQRLLDLIKETKATGVMFLTGDRHHAEISRLADGAGYPIYDITAGPLNGNSKWQNEINRHRLGSVLFEPNFGAISINWEESNPDINVYILDAKGNIKINTNLRLNDLRPAEAAPVAAP